MESQISEQCSVQVESRRNMSEAWCWSVGRARILVPVAGAMWMYTARCALSLQACEIENLCRATNGSENLQRGGSGRGDFCDVARDVVVHQDGDCISRKCVRENAFVVGE